MPPFRSRAVGRRTGRESGRTGRRPSGNLRVCGARVAPINTGPPPGTTGRSPPDPPSAGSQPPIPARRCGSRPAAIRRPAWSSIQASRTDHSSGTIQSNARVPDDTECTFNVGSKPCRYAKVSRTPGPCEASADREEILRPAVHFPADHIEIRTISRSIVHGQFTRQALGRTQSS
jgi:hypothetical protein